MEGEADDAVRLDAAPEHLHEGEREVRRLAQPEAERGQRVVGEVVAREEVAVVEERRVAEERQIQRAASAASSRSAAQVRRSFSTRQDSSAQKKGTPKGTFFEAQLRY